ncbi:hypothetical protein CAEBREN_30852, partial [Caenorhabditis brenneri]
MTALAGGLRIENSKFTSLSFLPKNMKFICGHYGLFILNNSQLTDISVIPTFTFFEDGGVEECKVEIINNPKLNLEDIVWEEALTELSYLKTEGNLIEGGCDGEKFSLDNLSLFENCQNVYNGLKLYNVSSAQVSSALSNVYLFRGFLDIQNTDYQDLSFLESLQYIQTKTKEKVMLNLQNNPNMTRIALPKLQDFINLNLYGFQYINIENLHPDFCITLTEFQLFFQISVDSLKLHAKLCELTDEEKNQEVPVCYFESISDLDKNCVTIIGNIQIH